MKKLFVVAALLLLAASAHANVWLSNPNGEGGNVFPYTPPGQFAMSAPPPVNPDCPVQVPEAPVAALLLAGIILVAVSRKREN